MRQSEKFLDITVVCGSPQATVHKEMYSIAVVFKFHGRAIRTKKSKKTPCGGWG